MLHIEELYIEPSATVLEAMKKLDETGQRILFVAPEGRLAAVLTDGDVRKYILRGGSLDGPVSGAANYHPVSLPVSERGSARAVLEQKGIDALPLLDKSELSIHEIAARVGVEDPFYFNRLFRRFYGMAPREYRKKIRGEKE